MPESIHSRSTSPIGYVRSTRKEIIDDNWDREIAYVELIEELPSESLHGLNSFSHAEIIFHFNQAPQEKIEITARQFLTLSHG